MAKRWMSRRAFLGGAAGVAAFTIVPRHVLGGPGRTAPSDVITRGTVGTGGQGMGHVASNRPGEPPVQLAVCDVHRGRLAGAMNKAGSPCKAYTDFRRVLERRDIDVIHIATPPHWHALVSIAAMQAGKDVLCEKPFTRFIAEGRAVVNAERRYGRIIQVGTYGRYGAVRNGQAILTHKIMASGLLKDCRAVHVHSGGFKVKEWSGLVNAAPQPVPAELEWDMYCGPSPLRPYQPHRFGGTHRGYWDYEGGGMGDMGQHYFDPVNWTYAKDATSPVEVEPFAPPAHPEAAGMWGWVELRYADGFTIVMNSGEWGPKYDRKRPGGVSLADLSPEDQKKVQAMPDPQPFPQFYDCVRTRQQPGGHAEAAHRTACLMHLANIAIRVGRRIQYDPVKEQIVGDEEANRLAYQPMRWPWHL
jgi:hypothetical protein